MKIISVLVIVASLIGLSFVSKTRRADKNKETRSITGSYAPVAVLELFTSEGCSSCPPADRLLPELIKLDPNIIPLSFHVDYWNRLGWTDPFSSSEFSERQREYVNRLNLESAYTPELVVNGEYEFVGSDRVKAESAIKEALKEKARIRLTIDNVKTGNEKLSFTVHNEGVLKQTDILAAFVQKQATMKVRAGENNGATLTHINIVRSLSKQTAAAKNEFEIEIPDKIAGDNWQLVVYAQQQLDLKITGVGVYNPDEK
jgi:hypothetical protein